MKRTQVAREVRDHLHATEAAMDAVVANAEATLARMVLAKTELGLTGTMGDAAIARMRDTVAGLKQARFDLADSHNESYTVLRSTQIRGVANNPTNWAWQVEETRAA